MYPGCSPQYRDIGVPQFGGFFIRESKEQISRGRLLVNLEEFFRREKRNAVRGDRLFVNLEDFLEGKKGTLFTWRRKGKGN